MQPALLSPCLPARSAHTGPGGAIRPWRLLAAPAVALAILAACGESSPRNAPDRTRGGAPEAGLVAESGIALPEPRMLPIGQASPEPAWKSQNDVVSVAGHPFLGELETSRPLAVSQPSELEFWPLAMGPVPSDCRLETYVLSAGEERLAAASAPFVFNAPDLRKEKRFAFLSRPVRVDLSPYAGRRISLRWVLKGTGEKGKALSGAIANPTITPKDPPARPRPNILFLCSDAHRRDRAVEGRGSQLMPNLRQFAAAASVYENAFANASWTLPSITSTLTGRFPQFHRTGFRMEEGSRAQDTGKKMPAGLFEQVVGEQYFVFTAHPKRLRVLPERLQEQGYATALVVSNPLYILSGLSEDGWDCVADAGIVPGDVVNDYVFSFLGHVPKDRPLFVLAHYMDTHEYAHLYPAPNPTSAEDFVIASYENGVRAMDRNLETLLRKWGESVGWDNSLIVFYADHGEHLFDPGRNIAGHGMTMDEVLLHVPLIVKYPVWANVPPGPVAAPASLVDLYPTVLDLLGARLDRDPLDGRSLIGAAQAAGAPGRAIFADYQLAGDELSSVRRGPFKLVLDHQTKERYLVDTRIPPAARGELDEIVDNAEQRGELARLYDEYEKQAVESAPSVEGDPIVNRDDMIKNLRALGYLK